MSLFNEKHLFSAYFWPLSSVCSVELYLKTFKPFLFSSSVKNKSKGRHKSPLNIEIGLSLVWPGGNNSPPLPVDHNRLIDY